MEVRLRRKGNRRAIRGKPYRLRCLGLLGLGALRFKYYVMGVESYYEPKVEFVRTQVFNSRRNFARNLAVGKIGVLPSKFPKFPAPRNVLYKGADEETEGFATRITEVWELSGPSGWDKQLYGKSTL